jgi:hypothetical protein
VGGGSLFRGVRDVLLACSASSLYPRRLVDDKQEGRSVLGQDAEPVNDVVPCEIHNTGARETRRGKGRPVRRMRCSFGRAAVTEAATSYTVPRSMKSECYA